MIDSRQQMRDNRLYEGTSVPEFTIRLRSTNRKKTNNRGLQSGEDRRKMKDN